MPRPSWARPKRKGEVEPVLDDLDAIVADVLTPNPTFAVLLASPLLAHHDKDKILVETFEGRALPTVLQFPPGPEPARAALGLIASVARTARATWDRRQNRRPVAVHSAVPLDDAQQAALPRPGWRRCSAPPRSSSSRSIPRSSGA